MQVHNRTPVSIKKLIEPEHIMPLPTGPITQYVHLALPDVITSFITKLATQDP